MQRVKAPIETEEIYSDLDLFERGDNNMEDYESIMNNVKDDSTKLDTTIDPNRPKERPTDPIEALLWDSEQNMLNLLNPNINTTTSDFVKDLNGLDKKRFRSTTVGTEQRANCVNHTTETLVNRMKSLGSPKELLMLHSNIDSATKPESANKAAQNAVKHLENIIDATQGYESLKGTREALIRLSDTYTDFIDAAPAKKADTLANALQNIEIIRDNNVMLDTVVKDANGKVLVDGTGLSSYIAYINKALNAANMRDLSELTVPKHDSKFSMTKVNTDGEGTFGTIAEYAKGTSDKSILFLKGIFQAKIDADGTFTSNADVWKNNPESVNTLLSRITTLIDQSKSNVDQVDFVAARDNVKSFLKVLVDDVNNKELWVSIVGTNENGKYNKGKFGDFMKSPLMLLAYSIDNSLNRLDPSILATIATQALQVAHENSQDLIKKLDRSVTGLLGNTVERNAQNSSAFDELSKIGIPKSLMLILLQERFMSLFKLNLDPTKTPADISEGMATQAAQTALSYLVKSGVLLAKTYTKEELRKSYVSLKYTPDADYLAFYKLNTSMQEVYSERGVLYNEVLRSPEVAARLDAFKNLYNLGNIITKSERVSEGLPSLDKKDATVFVRDGTGSAEMLTALHKLSQIPRVVIPYFSNIIKNTDDMISLLKLSDADIKDVNGYTADKMKAVNAGVLDNVLGNAKFLTKNPKMLNFFSSFDLFSNGRFAPKSNIFNPVNDKIARSFVREAATERTINKEFLADSTKGITNETLLKNSLALTLGLSEKSTMAQGAAILDIIEAYKPSPEIANIVKKALVKGDNLTIDDLSSLFKEAKDKSLPIVTNDIGHIVNVLDIANGVLELGGLSLIKDGAIQEYTSHQQTTIDAKTSAIAMQNLTHGQKNTNGNAMTGIFPKEFADKNSQSYHSNPNNTDMYQSIIEAMSASLNVNEHSPQGEHGLARDFKKSLGIIEGIIGSSLSIDKGTGAISKTARNLAKKPTMTTAYMAGKDTTERRIVTALQDLVIDQFSNIYKNKDVKALAELNKTLLDNKMLRPLTMPDLLKKSAVDALVKNDKFNHSTEVYAGIMTLVARDKRGFAGRANASSISSIEEFLYFVSTLTESVKIALVATSPSEILMQSGRNLINLIEDAATLNLKTPMGSRTSSGINISERILNPNGNYTLSNDGTGAKQGTSHTVRIYGVKTDLGVAPVPKSIHAIEGALLAKALIENGGSGIYDAITNSPYKIIDSARRYNEAIGEIFSDYNSVSDILESTIDARAKVIGLFNSDKDLMTLLKNPEVLEAVIGVLISLPLGNKGPLGVLAETMQRAQSVKSDIATIDNIILASPDGTSLSAVSVNMNTDYTSLSASLNNLCDAASYFSIRDNSNRISPFVMRLKKVIDSVDAANKRVSEQALCKLRL